MANNKNTLKIILLFIVVFSLSLEAQARNGKKRKAHLANSINEAVKRSNKEQRRIQVRFDDEADERMNSWSQEDIENIEIKHTKTSKRERVDLGKPDFTLDQSGEDESGLDRLRSDVVEEPIFIDFDEELREVSSTKD